MRARSLSASLLVLAILPAAVAADLARSKEGKFQIDFPAQVKEHEGYFATNKVTQWHTFTFSLIKDGVIYEAKCYRFTAEGQKSYSIPKSIRSRYDSAVRKAKSKKATILLDRADSEATVFSAQYPDGKLIRYGWYRKSNRMYEVHIEGPSTAVQNQASRFFQSFRMD